EKPALVRENQNFNLVLKKPHIIKGSIKEINEFKNYKKIKLSNGIEFLYKETDFEKDKIYIKLFKEGGSLKDSDLMYINSQFVSEIADNSGAGNIEYKDVERFMKGKEFSVGSYINDFEHGFIIVSNGKDLETALDCFYYMEKEPKFSQDAYKYIMANVKEMVENRKNSPNEIYSDKIIEIFFKNNIRKRMISYNELNLLTIENLKEEYKNKFSDFTGFKGIILGSVNEEKAKEILEKYFASLPSGEKIQDTKAEYLDIKYPQGEIKEEVIKGIDKKVKVTLYYPVKIEYSQENMYKAKTFEDVLRINLIDEVREKLGGVYGISPKIFMSENENGYLVIKFSTDPKRADEITEAVKRETEKLAEGEIKKSSLESVVKNYKIVYEDNQKQNGYWFNYLGKKLKKGDMYEPYSPKVFEESMTEEKLKPIFKKIIDKTNCIQVRLIPEREE
ncbi:MAG: M16 family metallopeptidase, partial [Fusobacterium sp.]